MKSNVLLLTALLALIVSPEVTKAVPVGPISTMSCTLTENIPGEAIVQPVTINFGYGTNASLQSVTMKLSKGGRVVALAKQGAIAYRLSSNIPSLKLTEYANDPGVQKCDFTETLISTTDGVSIKAKCEILPESGIPVQTLAIFEFRLAPQKLQDFGGIQVGSRQFQTGYKLSACTAK